MVYTIDEMNENTGTAVKFDDVLKIAPVGTLWQPNDPENANLWLSLGKITTDGISDSGYFEKGDTYYSFNNVPEAVGTGEIAGDIEFTSVTVSNRNLRLALNGKIFNYGDDGVSFFTQRKARQQNEYAFICAVKIKGVKKVIYIARGILSQTGEVALQSDDLVNVPLAITPLVYEGGVTATDYDIEQSATASVINVNIYQNGASGEVDKLGTNVANNGDDFTVTATDGTITDWLLNGASTGISSSSYTINNVDDNYSITAVFQSPNKSK